MALRTAVTVLMTMVSAAPLSAQTHLAWKFRAGDQFAVKHRIIQFTDLEAKHKPFQQESDMTLRTAWKVKQADAGKATLTVVVTSMDSKTYPGNGKAAVPSKDDEKWRGAEFELVVDAQGRLHGLKGREELLKKLAGSDPQLLKVMSALKPADSFQALFQNVLGPLPAKPVAAKDQWQHAAVDAMSIFGSFQQATTFTYRGAEGPEHVVSSVTKTTYQAPRYAIENDVFRVLKGKVTADDGLGRFAFDIEQGRMLGVRRQVNVRGELTLETLSGQQRVTFTTATTLDVEVSK